MGRRTSGQQVGLQSIGNVQANESTLTTTQTNSDLTLDPNGSGAVVVNSDVTIRGQFDLRLADSDSSNYVALQAPASVATNFTLTLPNAVPASNGYVLQSTTSGELSWAPQTTAGITSSDPGSSSVVHYPFFATNAGNILTGQVTAFNTKSNFSFIPTSGTLSATVGSFPTVVGGSTSSGTLTIRGTSSGTKAVASVLFDDGVASTSSTTGTVRVTGGVGISGSLFTGAASTIGGTLTVSTGGANITGTTNIAGELQCASGNTIKARYNSSDSYAAALSWNTLQLGNNGDNNIVGGQSNTGGNLRFWVNATNSATGGSWSANGTNALTLGANGNATFSGTITENSSIAYKENVNPIMDALDKILMLTGVTYDRTAGSDNKNEAGLIAEQVYEVLPNLVQLKDGKPDGVCYNRLTAYLIEAVKTLKSEIDSLKK